MDDTNINNRDLVRKFIFILLILVVTFIVFYLLLGRTKYVKLNQSSQLSGTISQFLNTSGGNTKLPVLSKDYKLKNVQYFDNNTWAIATIVPINNNLNQSTVVLTQKNGDWIVVLGPGGAFDSSYILSLPKDVGHALTQQGLIYEPVL